MFYIGNELTQVATEIYGEVEELKVPAINFTIQASTTLYCQVKQSVTQLVHTHTHTHLSLIHI